VDRFVVVHRVLPVLLERVAGEICVRGHPAGSGQLIPGVVLTDSAFYQ